jgi:hypothetical protein
LKLVLSARVEDVGVLAVALPNAAAAATRDQQQQHRATRGCNVENKVLNTREWQNTLAAAGAAPDYGRRTLVTCATHDWAIHRQRDCKKGVAVAHMCLALGSILFSIARGCLRLCARVAHHRALFFERLSNQRISTHAVEVAAAWRIRNLVAELLVISCSRPSGRCSSRKLRRGCGTGGDFRFGAAFLRAAPLTTVNLTWTGNLCQSRLCALQFSKELAVYEASGGRWLTLCCICDRNRGGICSHRGGGRYTVDAALLRSALLTTVHFGWVRHQK